MQKRVDTASKLIHAPAATIYNAFSTADAMKAWLPPQNMTGTILEFAFHEGGGYRMRLTYDDPQNTLGKTSDNSDEVEVSFVKLTLNERIEQAVKFECDDPAFSGEMRIMWKLQPVQNGTLVTIRCEDIPVRIGKEDHLIGLNASLNNLATFAEDGMSTHPPTSGFVNIDNAKIYYEVAGEGTPFVMIYAGVADNRQWSNEFAYFSKKYQVIRYDMRGYGKSEPVEGEFSHLRDFVSLLDTLGILVPILVIGCSMGGGLAMDFALTYPSRVKALIMVDSGPNGLDLDVPSPSKFAEAEKAFESGDLDLVAEIETQIWFDGIGRKSNQVNSTMRKLLYEMNRVALFHEAKELGKRLPNTEIPAYNRLENLNIPVLIIVGSQDIPYILAAADFMKEKIKFAKKIIIEDAAHLPNMDQPLEFRSEVENFLSSSSMGA